MRNLIFISLFFLASCSGVGSGLSLIGDDYYLNPSKTVADIPANYGVIIGSMTSNDLEKQEYTRGFHYKSLDANKVEDVISVKTFYTRPEYEDEVFALLLPEGSYEFYDFYMFGEGGIGSVTWSPNNDFSVPFNVVAGKAIYIGDIENIPTVGENMFGLSIPTGGYFQISNQIDRDLPLLKKKYNVLNQLELLNGTLKRGKVSPELIRFK